MMYGTTKVWNDVEGAFRNHGEGNRILLTSRDFNVALEAKGDSVPIHLPPLSFDESCAFF